jgi:hypothetical protein
MTLINGPQLTAIHALLSELHLRDEKESIIREFTGGRTTSSRSMTKAEARALIAHLKSVDPKDKGAEKMRNKVLSMCHEMGWRIPGTDRIDMDHVNNWCVSRSYLKKKLDDYTHKELPLLVTQVEQFYQSFLKRI